MAFDGAGPVLHHSSVSRSFIDQTLNKVVCDQRDGCGRKASDGCARAMGDHRQETQDGYRHGRRCCWRGMVPLLKLGMHILADALARQGYLPVSQPGPVLVGRRHPVVWCQDLMLMFWLAMILDPPICAAVLASSGEIAY